MWAGRRAREVIIDTARSDPDCDDNRLCIRMRGYQQGGTV